MTEYAGWFIDIRAGNALISASGRLLTAGLRGGPDTGSTLAWLKRPQPHAQVQSLSLPICSVMSQQFLIVCRRPVRYLLRVAGCLDDHRALLLVDGSGCVIGAGVALPVCARRI